MTGAKAKPSKVNLPVEVVAFIQRRIPRLRQKTPDYEVYSVPSLSSGDIYQVANWPKLGKAECNCKAFTFSAEPKSCKHVELVRVFLGVPPVVEVHMEPWKGKDQIQFEYSAETCLWKIVTHQKDKETWEVDERVYEVKHEDVQALYAILKQMGADRGPVRTPDIWLMLIYHHGLKDTVTRDNFNGGRLRSKVYFPLFWGPCKVLEHKGFILYGSKTVQLLKVVEKVEPGVGG